MNILVSSSTRCAMTPDGQLWTSNASRGYSYWTRYLDVFDEVRLLARARPCLEPPPAWIRATGQSVVPLALPHYVGPAGYAWSLPELRRRISAALATSDAIQLRLPCPIGDLVRRSVGVGRPYAVEVVGDPYDAFAPGAVRHVMRPFFRRHFARAQKQACAAACGVAYVTERSLQRRYPAASDAFTTSYSDIELRASAILGGRRPSLRGPRSIALVTVGTLEQLYKAHDILIDAVALCVDSGLDVHLRIVGEGKHRDMLARRARNRGIGQRVAFLGQLPMANAVEAELDKADIFVLPSRAESLPKALIEAMARALPCIGSSVGGIPELLPPEDIVAPGDPLLLALKILHVAAEPGRMSRMSAQNVRTAARYSTEVLRPRRVALYKHLERCTLAWLENSGASVNSNVG